MSERVQQLESQIQGKLEQARERRESIEREQKEKLRNHVSFRPNVALEIDVVALGSTFLYRLLRNIVGFRIDTKKLN